MVDMTAGEVGRSLARLEVAVDKLRDRVRRLEIIAALAVTGGTTVGSALGSWLGGG